MGGYDHDYGGKQLVVSPQNDEKLSFEKMEQIVYLWVVIGRDGNGTKEIEARTIKRNKVMGAMRKILKSKNKSTQGKVRMHKTMIRPTVTHAAEIWMVNKAEQDKWKIWERKMLRIVYCAKNVHEVWCRRSNSIVYQLYNDPDIIKIMKRMQLGS